MLLAALQISWKQRKFWHQKSPIPTRFFGALIWPPWRHVKTIPYRKQFFKATFLKPPDNSSQNSSLTCCKLQSKASCTKIPSYCLFLWKRYKHAVFTTSRRKDVLESLVFLFYRKMFPRIRVPFFTKIQILIFNVKTDTLLKCKIGLLIQMINNLDQFAIQRGPEWKIIPLWIHRFFSQRKILMIRIFDLILDFSKETHS